ncbi:homeobox protein, cut isoform X4 [Rhodnius prolixus]|uniref:homeobox protein, cut isoform X4 n=1 Tax=Rhodnius prolixus TaxID=13249 RepID=UPI003D18D56D
MDIHGMQSMDWLFKKERIYLLAQFWQQRATLAEKEVSALKEQLAVASSGQAGPDAKMASQLSQGSDEVITRSSIELELSAKDKEISQLLEDVQRLQNSIGKLQENSANQIARLEEELEHKRQHICRLEARLEAQKDYNELKRQVSNLRGEDMCKQEEPEKCPSELAKPPPSITPSEVQTGSDVPTLHNVETFGSFLGEEIVANWRRSVERTIVSQSARPTPPPNTWPGQYEGKVKSEEPRERDGDKGSPAGDVPLVNGTSSPTNHEQEQPSNNNNINSSSNNNKSSNNSISGSNNNSNTSTTNNNNSNNNNNSTTNNNNNNNTTNNNNPLLANGMCANMSVGLNNNVLPAGGPLNLNDVIKSPFRFDDRSPFRLEDPGCMVGRFGESLIPKGDPMEARLQEMLRYNMDKYANQNLDTLSIARRVRELLSIHNVGQRLFAKYVLGLSQGTVSELLSKPKPWDKLTEKGRDSYRKMHAWACDENAVLLLKSLIPKKGKDSGGGVSVLAGRGAEAEMTEERIAHILSEASHMMKPQHPEDTHSNDDSKSPNHPQSSESPLGRDNSQNRRLKKYENDDISQEQVVRIYQEELAKLMGRRLEDQPFPGLVFPHFLSSGGSGEDVRIAMDAYQRELAKLNAGPPGGPLHHPLAALHAQSLQAAHNGIAQDLSLPKPIKREKSATGSSGNGGSGGGGGGGGGCIDDDKKEDQRHGGSGSAFSLVRPKMEPGSPLGNVILPPEDVGNGSGAAAVSPLQRMASITNALISQPPSQHHHSPSQRPLKAVLPPITQQQFDQFNNLNTEEIVRKVKEQLSQFSISQRLFGESVLGLSQGSVSDLLARPKPWHMLTQKGREPFIRMKMFLEDENAVHKLVASQYKIAPEKLMRTGGYGINPSTPHSKGMPSGCGKFGGNEAYLHNSGMHIAQQHTPAPPPVSPLTPPDVKKCILPPQQGSQSTACHTPVSMQQYPGAPAALKSLPQVSPSVYEMAALTQDLDTQSITTKIKEALLANNIGQKIFGEAVLGLSQGSVSELLSKPKPWHMLSIKGREPFIRMQLWLSDSNNIDKLQAIKTERRELNKRRRGSGQQDNSSDTSSNDTSEFYHSGGGAGSPPSAKKHRVFFSEEQKEALRLAFALDPYPSLATIEFLANELSLVSRTITNWFHNHRMRLKQSPQGESLSREGQGSGFDPVQFRILLSQRLGLPLPFPAPFFHSTAELSGAMSRGELGSPREPQGLDLSLKHDYEAEETESQAGSEDSFSGMTESSSRVNPEPRASRRKPAAPQWVNPDWQQQEPEVIINGVCVMRTEDFDREGREETVRVEPTPVPEERATPERTPETPTDESLNPSLPVKQEVRDEKWENPY